LGGEEESWGAEGAGELRELGAESWGAGGAGEMSPGGLQRIQLVGICS